MSLQRLKVLNTSMVFVTIAVSKAITGLSYGPRVPLIENVMCNGSEYMLDQCQTSEPGQVSQVCTESSTRAAGVRCYQGWQYEPFRCLHVSKLYFQCATVETQD